ncbi:shikimate dehydrogenase [Danxiaibacter flavus]|uniref:Shikimate dehydrogenase n=1 Tax=Danxiaibacter flavus TaxID=3049108 RepID=A0ABV3ZFE3_9BACT|nr:shikimate dehydrogenase [Chitinophagaceae bacterium DXS]
MPKYGLIGYPLGHSFSQKYFTEKFLQEGIENVSFENFSIPSIEDLDDVLLNNPDLKGLAVTIPYKKQVMDYLDETDAAVKQIGACNCITIRNGKLTGYNTDIIGFEQSFIRHLQPHHKQALILGTGGAALAIEYVLNKLSIPFQYVSRRQQDNTITYSSITESIIDNHKIIINCTPLGTYPEVNECPPLPYEFLTERHYLYDLVYNPPLTRFLKEGAERGAVIQNGYDMLVLQAEANWEIWNAS